MQRIVTTILFLMLSLNLSAQDSSRKVISLNSNWKFIVDSLENGVNLGWNSALPQTATIVKIPHTWNVMKGLENYTGSSWYEKRFTAPLNWANKHIQLKFGAVYHDAIIYINGKKIAEHKNSGYTTFYIDISKQIKLGDDNRLIVLVNNKYSKTTLPFKKVFDWPNDGGIIRNVDLVISGKPSLRYVHVTPDINFLDTSATLLVKIRLWENNIKRTKFNIIINEKNSGKTIFEKRITLDKNKSADEFATSFVLKKIKLWRFDHPFLYQIKVVTQNNADEEISRFGIRKIELKGKKFLLNNEEVRLPGIEYMPSSYPDYGSAEPYWIMDSVVNMMKDLNATITRFHWQVDEHILDQMDEKGVLLQAEIPWWQQPNVLTPQLMKTAKMQLTEMIERDYNHPCIFAWGLSNEVLAGTDKNQYIELKKFVRKQDNNRLINVVSNKPFERKQQDESLIGDLPTWNEYIGTWFGNFTTDLPKYFNIMESFLGDRPLLITENGLCEPRFSGGDLRRSDDMLYHYKEWAKRDYVAGCIYFCLNDYRTHIGEDGAGKFKARIHGITDLYFNKKPSYTIFKQLACPIEIVNIKKLSEHSLSVQLFNKNSLPCYSLQGYSAEWKTTAGKRGFFKLPFMKPGDKISIRFDNMENRFSFKIVSPTGSLVTAYPVIQ